ASSPLPACGRAIACDAERTLATESDSERNRIGSRTSLSFSVCKSEISAICDCPAACGERSPRSCAAGEGDSPLAVLVEVAPHPNPLPDLNSLAGRGRTTTASASLAPAPLLREPVQRHHMRRQLLAERRERIAAGLAEIDEARLAQLLQPLVQHRR